MKKKTGATLYILIALLVGVLYFSGRVVTPAPKGPPAPEPSEAQAAPPPKEEHEHTEGDGHDHAAEGRPKPLPAAPDKPAPATEAARMKPPVKPTPPRKPRFDPGAVEVSTDYWAQNPMGQAGIRQMEVRVKKANEELARERAKLPLPKEPKGFPNK